MNSFSTSSILLAFGAAMSASGAMADAVIPLDMSGPRPTAQLTIEGHAPVAVIFDTGAHVNIIDPKYATEIGLPNLGDTQVFSPGSGSVKGFSTKLPNAKLGEADISGARMLAIDLKLPLGDVKGLASPNLFAGIMGLNGKLVRFEYGRSRAIVSEKNSSTMPKSTAYPYENGLPAAIINVAGVELHAHLDAGSSLAIFLPMELSKKLPLTGPLVPRKSLRMAGADHAAFDAQLNGKMTVGPLVVENPAIVFAENVPFADVGFATLRNLVMVLDPAGQRDWILKAD